MGDVGLRVNAPHVIHESIDGEVIVINLGTGSYYSLKGSGAAVWHALDQGRSTAHDLVDALEALYEGSREEFAAGVQHILRLLRDEGLIVEAETAVVAAAPVEEPTGSKMAFELPNLEKFTDMQDLVLLDPVHEVDATGWPQPRPDDAAVA
jgi:Coenzyme PQQ synthesis protein D (PqqD)